MLLVRNNRWSHFTFRRVETTTTKVISTAEAVSHGPPKAEPLPISEQDLGSSVDTFALLWFCSDPWLESHSQLLRFKQRQNGKTRSNKTERNSEHRRGTCNGIPCIRNGRYLSTVVMQKAAIRSCSKYRIYRLRHTETWYISSLPSSSSTLFSSRVPLLSFSYRHHGHTSATSQQQLQGNSEPKTKDSYMSRQRYPSRKETERQENLSR